MIMMSTTTGLLYFCEVLNKMNIWKQGVQPCSFYLQHGHCKFGSTCKFDHPMGTLRYSPSESSVLDSPLPAGSLLATLVPSSSSFELQAQLTSGTYEDGYLSRMPLSGSTTSTSDGLIFSDTGSAPFTDLQLSNQSSVSLSSSRTTRLSGEIHRSSWFC